MKLSSQFLVLFFLTANLLVIASPRSQGQTFIRQKFVWRKATLNGRVYDKAALLVPVRIPSLPKKKCFLQIDLGADQCYLYKPMRSKLTPGQDYVEQTPEKVLFKFTLFGHRYQKPFALQENTDLSLTGDTLIVGLIGIDFFENQKLILDFPRNELSLVSGALPKAYADAKKIKARYEQYRFVLPLVYNGTDTLRAFYDSGASELDLILTKAKWQQATGKRGDEPDLHEIKGPGPDGKETVSVGAPLKGSLAVGGQVFTGVEAYYLKVFPYSLEDIAKQSGVSFEGVIGNKLFYDHYTLIFDFKNQELLLKK
ncbi:hypothetical protein IC235_18010 [Hymenobacter sp. BT664]|uniref:Aspartyl protease n=1 Tax=Hymenobacter montanus TaxID=2771359 RepID=A0A927BGT0_9BACT|nr:hypothetical protein [Hymenobacter montanus]MBD2769788.1 hypothetical protein [Hymenobacter montanus]